MTSMTRILGLYTFLDSMTLKFFHGVNPATVFRAGKSDRVAHELLRNCCPSQFTQCFTLGTGEGEISLRSLLLLEPCEHSILCEGWTP